MKKISGIYKIVSPSNRVYIGQSVNILRRFKQYKSNHPGNRYQIKLWKSFQKYGVENHIFEVLEEVEREFLNIRERYYQDLFEVIDRDKGLNLILTRTDKIPCIYSKETCEKISNSLKGKRKGIKLTEEHRKKIAIANTGYKMPMQQRMNISKGLKFKNSKKLIDTVTGEIYLSVGDASEKLKIKYGTLRAMLNGQNKNKTNLITYE